MTEEKQVRVVSDGRRLDVLLSEASGLTRSRVASLMEEGCCVSGGKECRKAGTKIPEGQEIILTVPAPREAAPRAEEIRCSASPAAVLTTERSRAQAPLR